MGRTIPNKGYGGIYGEEAAGKDADAVRGVRGQRSQDAASDFASAERSASQTAPQIDDRTTSSSSGVAESGGNEYAPKYGGGASASLAGGTVAAAAAKATPMGMLAKAANSFRGNGSGSSKKPLLTVGGITFLVGGMWMMINSMLPLHFLSNFSDMRNSLFSVNSERQQVLLRRTLRHTGDVDNLFTGRNRVSNARYRQMNHRLEPNGFRFEYDSSLRHYVLLDAEGRLTADGRLDFEGARRINSEAELQTRFNTDARFRTAWNNSTRPMTGETAGWWNSALRGVLATNMLTRALFRDWAGEQDARAATRAAQERIAGREQQFRDRIAIDAERVNVDPGEAGTENQPGRRPGATTETTRTQRARYQEMSARIQADIRFRATQMAAGGVGILAVGTCAVRMAVAATAAVHAMEQAIRGVGVVADWFSAGQMVMAGDGNDAYHAFGAMLTEPMVTTTLDSHGNEIELHGGRPLSATEARGMQAVLIGGVMASSGDGDPSVSQFHMEGGGSWWSEVGADTVRGCAAAVAAASAVSLAIFAVTTVLKFIPPFGTMVGGAISIATYIGGEIAEDIIFGGIVGLIVGAISSTLAVWAIRTIATDVGGEDFGNMLASFGGRYFGKACQGNGCTTMTYEHGLAQHRAQQEVLAQMAEVDRATRSPFDVTNQNTFLGKISMNMAFASATSSNSFFGWLGSFGTLSSRMRVPVNVNAAVQSELRFREIANVGANGASNCDRLYAAGGMIGDMFCNPLRGSDRSTIPYDPEYIFWRTAWWACDGDNCSFGGRRVNATAEEFNIALNGFSGTHPDDRSWSIYDPNARCSNNSISGWGTSGCNGDRFEITEIRTRTDAGGAQVEQINRDSPLGNMVRFGVNRASDPGIIDQAILEELSEVTTGSGFWDRFFGALPIVGEVLDIIEQFRRSRAMDSGWVDGQAFCAGCGHEDWERQNKFLSQYIIDTNLYENMGAINQSPVTAFIETELWPEMDNSWEGIVARNMGVSREWVVDALAFSEDLRNVPRDVDSLIASAPHMFFAYYGSGIPDVLTIPENTNPLYSTLATMQESSRITVTDLRRRFNAEATA